MGAEASGIIESYNRRLKFPKGLITVPPIKGSMDDDYPSIIGDKQVNITKGDENTVGTLEILDTTEENTRGTLDMGSVSDVK